MALTATVQSVVAPERTWDEVIVPTLRKRLENESHVLAKRMSVASINSLDDQHPADSSSTGMVYASREKAVSPAPQYSKPSAIPRPSISHSRTDTSSSSYGRPSMSGSFQRPRTVSQPQPFEPTSPTVSPPLPPPVRPPSSRSNSPMVVNKSTRIPVSRGRTASTSSYQPSVNGIMGKPDSKTSLARSNGYAADHSSELWPVDERHHQPSYNSRSTLRTPRSQYSELLNESAPFNQNSISSRSGYDHDIMPPRLSSDSEEAPFEHWYRGDISRNGGVGELRVARKQEMLDIANYGHTIRQASSRVDISVTSRSRSNSAGRDIVVDQSHTRRRAGSLSGTRESIYIDAHTPLGSTVLDEQPLTDIDTDGDMSVEMAEPDTTERVQYTSTNGNYSAPSRSVTPTSSRGHSNFKSRIPTPTPRAVTEPPRTPTPTQVSRGASEPLPSTPVSAVSTPRKGISASQSQPNTSSQGQSAKRRGKSPAFAVNGTAVKKPRTSKSPAKSPPKKTKRNEDVRRSVAQYPNPEGDDIVDAIPTWTQPVPPTGNWDDVVLPVVARKKGLEGHYATADGSPKPKPPTETVYEPAPGTFGLDYSKTRPLRVDTDPDAIPMDEFGQRNEPIKRQPYGQPQMEISSSSVSPTSRTSANNSRSRPESPAPFSRYAVQEKSDDLPMAESAQPHVEPPLKMQTEKDSSGGCCKCIIM